MKKVLVVDDDELCTLLLTKLLSDEGFEARSASNAEKAVETGTAFGPDFLICDWNLKDAIGAQIAATLCKQHPQMQVIFITGMEIDALDRRLQDIKLVATLIKPIDFKQVISILRQK